jgi:hypothetical protein
MLTFISRYEPWIFAKSGNCESSDCPYLNASIRGTCVQSIHHCTTPPRGLLLENHKDGLLENVFKYPVALNDEI